jgi:hypothetical protein
MENINENFIDTYLTNKFNGKPLKNINTFLASLYDDHDWKACFFQKKPPSYKKVPDTYWMLTNALAKVCILVKVNEINQTFRPFIESQEAYVIRTMESNNYKVECVYSKPIYFDIYDIDQAVNGINSILGE